MVFSEKLKKHRINAGLTQDELGLKLGVTCRTIQNYESGSVYPKKRETYRQLAELFCTDIDYWLTESGSQAYLVDPQTAARKESLLVDVTKLFADKSLDNEELDRIMESIQDAYRIAKEQSRSNSSQ